MEKEEHIKYGPDSTSQMEKRETDREREREKEKERARERESERRTEREREREPATKRRRVYEAARSKTERKGSTMSTIFFILKLW